MPTSTSQPAPGKMRAALLALLLNPEARARFYKQGHAAVTSKANPAGHNACAATASGPHLELGELKGLELRAEGLSDKLKASGHYEGSADRADVVAGDLIVCIDLNGNKASDHVWHVIERLADGWFTCFDNEHSGMLHPRRLDGKDGKTPMRGRLRRKD